LQPALRRGEGGDRVLYSRASGVAFAHYPALASELRLRQPPALEHRNAHGGTRDLDAYRDAAGSLMDRVHAYFGWYYTHGAGLAGGTLASRAA